MTDVRQLEDAKSQALRKKWAYVARLCREAAEAASVDEDPAKVRRLLIRAAKHITEAEQMARAKHVVQGSVIDVAEVDAEQAAIAEGTVAPLTSERRAAKSKRDPN